MIHESKAVQIHVHHSNRRCLYVPRVPGSVKNPHNNNNNNIRFFFFFLFFFFFFGGGGGVSFHFASSIHSF